MDPKTRKLIKTITLLFGVITFVYLCGLINEVWKAGGFAGIIWQNWTPPVICLVITIMGATAMKLKK